MRRLAVVPTVLLAVACGGTGGRAPAPTLDRDAFNRAAQAADVPLFWRGDANGNGAPDPAEVAIVWRPAGLSWGPPAKLDLEGAIARAMAAPSPPAAADAERLAKLRAELVAAKPTLVEEPLADTSPAEREMLRHLLAVADGIERLYLRQKGADRFVPLLAGPAGDPLGRAVFGRNQGPFCEAPGLDADPACNALSPAPPRRSGLYPDSLQADANFCKALGDRPDARTLMDPFSVVVAAPDGTLSAVPYPKAFSEDMLDVAQHLDAAAAALASVPSEAPLQRYLSAAATAFRTGDWPAADEAWAAMNALNSRWYVRVAPDETYFEPCDQKAGFHLTLARIDQSSLVLQKKLDPWKSAMETALATLAGPPYVARKVDFHLPDFIRIVLNAGDDRDAFGATVGQSLPNWGAVANEGRGRTVAMTNLYTDADSKASFRRKSESLLCPAAMTAFTEDDSFDVLGTVLHEAAHNLGPAAEYAIDGKTDVEVFGGGLAAMLEELKAQTASLYYTAWLVGKGVLDADGARKAHLRNLLWSMGQTANGMYSGDGHAEPYPQLAAVQLGALLDAGAVKWLPTTTAANGRDRGCFDVDFTRFDGAIVELMTRIAQIKGRGDRTGAETMRTMYVDTPGPFATLRETLTARWRREPKTTFVYSVGLGD